MIYKWCMDDYLGYMDDYLLNFYDMWIIMIYIFCLLDKWYDMINLLNINICFYSCMFILMYYIKNVR